MNSNDTEKLLKSWICFTESDLINHVATEANHIELCIEYLAKKRKMSIEEYRLIFNDSVQKYVYQLLESKQIDKASLIVHNINKNLNCWFYQFICKCKNKELEILIFEHLRKNEGDKKFEATIKTLRFYWELLQEIRLSDILLNKIERILNIKRLEYEFLVELNKSTQQRIIIEVYFQNRNRSLLSHIEKNDLWEFFIDNKMTDDIIQWSAIQLSIPIFDNLREYKENTDLNEKFAEWSLEPDMYDYAVTALNNDLNNEILCDLFAAAGYFFTKEQKNPTMALKRICFTESFKQNYANINRFKIAQIFWKNKYFILFGDNIATDALDELINDENKHLHKLIYVLKTVYNSQNINESQFKMVRINIFLFLVHRLIIN